jgi:hypothetical protein
MKIACLHTAESNIPLFDEAAAALGLTLSHAVRADLYQRAIELGGADAAILADAAEVLSELDGDVVILNCTTICEAADRVGALRVDVALAEAAVARGGSVEVFVTSPSTILPTGAVFEAEAAKTGASITLTLVEDALPAFLAGDSDAHARLIAAAADASTADVAVLTQTSMTPATALMSRAAMTSPSAALNKAVDVLRLTQQA